MSDYQGVCCAFCTKFETAGCPVRTASPWSKWKDFCGEYSPDPNEPCAMPLAEEGKMAIPNSTAIASDEHDQVQSELNSEVAALAKERNVVANLARQNTEQSIKLTKQGQRITELEKGIIKITMAFGDAAEEVMPGVTARLNAS